MNSANNISAMSQAQTINECLRGQTSVNPAHSNGKPDVSSTTINIDVRFASHSTQPVQIKRRQTKMKKPVSLSQTPFTDLMLHSDKVEALLRAIRGKGSAPAARRTGTKPGPTRVWAQK